MVFSRGCSPLKSHSRIVLSMEAAKVWPSEARLTDQTDPDKFRTLRSRGGRERRSQSPIFPSRLPETSRLPFGERARDQTSSARPPSSASDLGLETDTSQSRIDLSAPQLMR